MLFKKKKTFSSTILCKRMNCTINVQYKRTDFSVSGLAKLKLYILRFRGSAVTASMFLSYCACNMIDNR